MITVCNEIVELGIKIREKGYNISELNEEQLEDVANDLLCKFKLKEIPVDIIHAADIMGFELLKVIFDNNEENYIGGALAISSKLKEQGYRTDKVIKVNKLNSQGHQRFTIVHEIYHYIFDSFFKERNQEYYDVFYENSLESHNDNEKRANRFAAAFLMPKEEFIKEFLYITNINSNIKSNELHKKLSEKFLVSEKAVEMRIAELGLSYGNQ